MPATFINMATVLVGSLIGIFFRNRIKEKYVETIFAAIALCTAAIGIMSAVKTEHIIVVIVCQDMAERQALPRARGQQPLRRGIRIRKHPVLRGLHDHHGLS